jgi:hypothetical protein
MVLVKEEESGKVTMESYNGGCLQGEACSKLRVRSAYV